MSDTAYHFRDVRPGDLIQADRMNRLQLAIAQLDERVAALEQSQTPPGGAGQVDITRVLGTRRVGELLEVQGVNFAVPVEQNTVTIDDVVIRDFGSSSNASHIYFIVPPIDHLPKQVDLRVTNGTTSDSTKFTLEPAQEVPVGSMSVTFTTGPEEATIEAGQPYTFVFTIGAAASLQETYDVKAELSGAAGGWTVDVGGTGTAQDTVTLDAGEAADEISQDIEVVVTPSSAAGDGDVATLLVTASSQRNPGGLNADSGEIDITVGDAPPTGQNDVILGGLSLASADLEGGAIVCDPGASVGLSYQVTVSESATYECFAELENGTAWSLQSPPPPMQTRPLTVGSIATVSFRLGAPSGSGVQDRVTIHIRKQSDHSVEGIDRRTVRTR